MLQSASNSTLFERLTSHPQEAIALRFNSESLTYAALNTQVQNFVCALLAEGKKSLAEERIALFLPAGFDYVVALLGIWRAGGVAVPLNVGTIESEIRYALETARVTRVFSDEKHSVVINAIGKESGINCYQTETLRLGTSDFAASRYSTLAMPGRGNRALMLFTSGTTNKPKGVVTTHVTLNAQIATLIQAWAWSSSDVIPLFLPMHHVHGIINVLCCALAAGATVDIFTEFNMSLIFERVAQGNYSLFMAVPTIYVKMITALEQAPEKQAICAGFKKMRLMISGSAACPVSVHKRWHELTQQVLLERYGMTEIGMALSNPYEGERKAGSVGQVLPGVELMLVDEQNNPVKEELTPGEIWIRGANVFLEYWENPEASQQAFASDGWFKTGDIATLENGYYRILGRSSIDIIKTGGEKVSALEIESTLLEHPDIAECAVLGLADDTWGEAITAAIVLKPVSELTPADLRSWCKSSMSAHKVPKRIEVIDSLPRNAMGKITKPALKKTLMHKLRE